MLAIGIQDGKTNSNLKMLGEIRGEMARWGRDRGRDATGGLGT
jgi:hypothetical protein